MNRPVAIVTGASSGIGAAITHVLCSSDYRVLGTYLEHSQRADALMHEINCDEERLTMMRADFSDPTYDFRGLVDTVIDRYGGLTAVVHCAALVETIPFAATTASDFDRILNVNLRAPLFLSQHAYQAHQQGRCRLRALLMVSSVSDRYAWHGPVYEMSKAGLSMLCRSLGYFLANAGIRVNGVAPGSVASERNLQDPNWNRDAVSAAVPLGHPGDPADVAGAVRFLLSDEAAYITGQVLTIDGGLSLRL